MKNFTLFLFLIAAPVSAEKLSLEELSAYLNGVTTAVSGFTQVNGNGSVSAGRMFLKRPGRIRLEYDPPNLGLVVVGGGQVAIFDPKSDSEPFRFPLNQTPLNIILQNNVDFKKQDMVREHFADGPTTVLTLQDPTHSDYGFIKLIFTKDPVRLRQWIVDNNSGNNSTVIVENWIEDQQVPDVLFNIQAEIKKRSR
jgi:outer membrane lipoprotein-sorting protein